MQFYVYAHLRPDFTPFYIGKGKGNRSHNFSQRSEYHRRIVAKYGAENITVEVVPCQSEQEAFLREQLAIKALRASGVKLCNMTDGGEGMSGYDWPEDARKKQSEKIKSVMSDPAKRAHLSMKAKKQFSTVEGRKKISVARTGKCLGNRHGIQNLTYRAKKGQISPNKGKKASLETRAKQSAAKKGKPSPHRRYDNIEKRKCLKCGKEFEYRNTPSRTERGKYCSRSCGNSVTTASRHAKRRAS